MIGCKISIERPGFPYTFPIDFSIYEVGQIYDDTEETFAAEIDEALGYDNHADLQYFWSVPIFPPDGTPPKAPQTLVRDVGAQSADVKNIGTQHTGVTSVGASAAEVQDLN